VNFKDAKDIELQTKYSQLHMHDVGNMNIESKYDTYRINSAKSIRNSGKYDDFRIESVGSFNLASKYTDIDIGTLHQSLRVDQKYGELDIQTLGSDVSYIEIESQYMDCDIHNTSSGYTLDFDGDYSDVRYNDGFSVKHKDFDGSDKEVTGKYGDGKTKISVSMRYGGFKIH